jgi:hypothetical protein
MIDDAQIIVLYVLWFVGRYLLVATILRHNVGHLARTNSSLMLRYLNTNLVRVIPTGTLRFTLFLA